MNLRSDVNAVAPAAVRVGVLDEAHIGQTNAMVSRKTRVHHKERRSRTPNLFELSFLAVTAGIAGLLDNNRVVLFTKLLETADWFHDLDEIAGSRGTTETQTPSRNLSPLLGVLGIVVALFCIRAPPKYGVQTLRAPLGPDLIVMVGFNDAAAFEPQISNSAHGTLW